MQSYLVFDFETTGLNPASDRIIQVGLCEVRGGVVARKTAWLVKQPVPIAPDAKARHGISDEQIRLYGETPEKSARALLKALRAAPVCIGHNIHQFDIRFMRSECRRLGLEMPDTTGYIDTAALYKGWKLGQPREKRESHSAYAERILSQPVRGLKYSIETCLDELGIFINEATLHDAGGDAYATHLIFQQLASRV